MAQARRKQSRGRASPSSHAFGMFISGMIVGGVAASFIIGMRSDDPESIGRGIEHMIAASKGRFQPQIETSPEPAPQRDATTEYEFYMVLPEIEHIVPETPPDGDEAKPVEESPDTVRPREPEQPPSATRERRAGAARYELQAGAFVRMQDADRLKARLALEGLESRIQKVSIEGRGDFFRVRLGPFDDPDRLAAADGKLAALGIKALRLRISGG